MNIPTHIEHWRMIDGYLNYEISSHGRVRNINTSKILKQHYNKDYCQIKLCNNGIRKNFRVHRLVAAAYCDNDNNYPEVDHIDQNKKNNLYTNLRWANRSINERNTGIRKDNTSGVKGVFYHKRDKIWYVYMVAEEGSKRKSKNFKTKEEAIKYRKTMEEQNGYTAQK